MYHCQLPIYRSLPSFPPIYLKTQESISTYLPRWDIVRYMYLPCSYQKMCIRDRVSEPSAKEEKTELKKKRKQLKELEEHRDKLQEYDCHPETLQERNSYSKTDKDATFMRMKEDAMRNGQTKDVYKRQLYACE